MKTRILVNQVGSKTININSSVLVGTFTGLLCPKLNNVLAKGKWLIFNNK